MNDDAPSLEDAQAAMKDAGLRATLEADADDWCWHVVGSEGKSRVIDQQTGAKVLLSRWLLDYYEMVRLTSSARWYPEICDDPTCVNPDHWAPKREFPKRNPVRAGTSIYVSEGKRNGPPLTPADHVAIRAKRQRGDTLSELAQEYGRDRSTISKIANHYGNYGFDE